MNSNEEPTEQLINLISAIFGLIACIISILATTTSEWEIPYRLNQTGLYEKCYYQNKCTKIPNKYSISIGFASVGQCLIVFNIISSFLNTFIYRKRFLLLIISIFFTVSCLLFRITTLTMNWYLYLNGSSAILFNAATGFLLLAAFTASYALGISFAVIDNTRRPIQMPLKFRSHSNVLKGDKSISREKSVITTNI